MSDKKEWSEEELEQADQAARLPMGGNPKQYVQKKGHPPLHKEEVDELRDEGWTPENDKLEDNFKKKMMGYLDALMKQMKSNGEREEKAQGGLAGFVAAPQAAMGYAPLPSISIRMIENGWIIQYIASSYVPVEVFATAAGLGGVVQGICNELEKSCDEEGKA